MEWSRYTAITSNPQWWYDAWAAGEQDSDLWVILPVWDHENWYIVEYPTRSSTIIAGPFEHINDAKAAYLMLI